MRLVAVPIAVLLAVSCSLSQEASKTASGTPANSVAADATLAAPTVAQTVAPTPIPATPTPAPTRQLTITASGFGVDTFGGVGWGFTIRNENLAEAAESVSVQIAWQDASGTVLGTDRLTIFNLGPGQHTGVGGITFSLSIKPGAQMTVQVLPTRWTPVSPIPPFTFRNAAYATDSSSARVLGVIESPYAKDVRSVRVSAIGVDGSGRIVGGGSEFIDFLPAGSTAAVSVRYWGTKPANVAMYAELPSLSLLGP